MGCRLSLKLGDTLVNLHACLQIVRPLLTTMSIVPLHSRSAKKGGENSPASVLVDPISVLNVSNKTALASDDRRGALTHRGSMAEESNAEATMDIASLYHEEMFTDRRVGAIRRLTPVTADGSRDPARPVLFLGQAEIMTNMGPVPINFEIEAENLGEATEGFAPAAQVAIERTVRQIQEMQRQQASQLVVPGGGMPNFGGAVPGMGRGGGKIQIP